ncbi:hypothetical protein BBOV_II001570 [Babesia bovis T2Bo]|uniref:hypothetical protein n=1 Tax=Babesia bovis T2Bo TaxID=484906 RepID=UPI001C35420A|nr:hypothetical protein BBOV_II001570 [Babesia bovis T2Bo]EDO06114.2 hypothetical protein BBOV_II001570 [Babesia bovis T2Bo]
MYRCRFSLCTSAGRFAYTLLPRRLGSAGIATASSDQEYLERWKLLYQYTKRLARNKVDLTGTKCAILLFSIHQVLLDQSVIRGYSKGDRVTYLWDPRTHTGNVVSELPSSLRHGPDVALIDTKELIRYFRFMAILRPYYTLSCVKKDICLDRRHMDTPEERPVELKQPGLPKDQGDLYSSVFTNLLADNTLPSRPQYRTSTKSQIGPLRISSDDIIVYPRQFTEPLYIDVGLEPLDNCNHVTSHDTIYLVEKCLEELLTMLLVLLQDHNTVSARCVVPMFVVTMLYGPKMQVRHKGGILESYKQFHSGVLHSVIADNVTDLSYRSIAYLMNSCLNLNDMKLLCRIATSKLQGSAYIPLEWLENICYACSRAYYDADDIYHAASKHIAIHGHGGSAAACLNLLWSFSRVGKAHMVESILVPRICEFSAGELRSLSPGLRLRAAASLKEYLPAHLMATLTAD